MKAMSRFLLIIISIFSLSACVVDNKNYGYDNEMNSFSHLKINHSTKEDVLSLVGSPSTHSGFDGDTWYYITVNTKKFSVLQSNVTGHKVTKLKFKQDLLTDIMVYDGSKKKSLKFNKTQSDIKGDDSGILKDFLYNMGRYNKNNPDTKGRQS